VRSGDAGSMDEATRHTLSSPVMGRGGRKDETKLPGPRVTPELGARVFVSAPEEVDVRPLMHLLRDRDFEPFTALDAPVSSSLRGATFEAMDTADIVVVLVTQESSRSMFEAGIAVALGKQVVVGVTDENVALPVELSPLPTVRLSSADLGPVADLVDRLRVAGAPPDEPAPRGISMRLGRKDGNRFMTQIAESRAAPAAQQRHDLLVKALSGALAKTGLQSIASPREGGRFDIAVWEPRLASVVGTPVLIEVKASLFDHPSAFEQAAANAARAGASWSLLVYDEGPPEAVVDELAHPYPVLPIAAARLVEELTTEAFERVVRQLRARRAHGPAPS
jgi:hypothetical protein